MSRQTSCKLVWYSCNRSVEISSCSSESISWDLAAAAADLSASLQQQQQQELRENGNWIMIPITGRRLPLCNWREFLHLCRIWDWEWTYGATRRRISVAKGHYRRSWAWSWTRSGSLGRWHCLITIALYCPSRLCSSCCPRWKAWSGPVPPSCLVLGSRGIHLVVQLRRWDLAMDPLRLQSPGSCTTWVWFRCNGHDQ